jgi:serine phosphatase RsbU (regulator of sigma subunit)
LEEANEVLCTHTPPSMFVTCFYGVLDPEGGHLRYANAGHDLPYSRRHDGMADELRVRGMPLGLMPSMGYEEKEALLAPEECVLFYSDGDDFSEVGGLLEASHDVGVCVLASS